MAFRNWKTSLTILLLAIAIEVNGQGIDPNGCLEFSAGVCIRCSENTHFYLNYCYQNILGCKRYENGSICVSCDESISMLQNGICTLLEGQGPSFSVAQNLYKYGNPGDRYGGTNYIPISFNNIKNNNTFIAMDVFLRRGEWGHFISKSANPVYSVHFRIREDTDRSGKISNSYGYKVLYQGTGGGLFLCIAEVSESYVVKILSLTVIELAQIVDNCIDYEIATTKCIRCAQGYHLQGDSCFQNYGDCLNYRENLCLRCNQNYLLIENRCVSDCVSISDARSILFYESRNTSSLETVYSVPVNTFYQQVVTTTTTTTTTTTFTQTSSNGGAILITPVTSRTIEESVVYFDGISS